MMRGQWYEDVYSLSICHFVPFHPRKVEVCYVVVFIILIILRILGGLLSLWKKHWCVLRDDTFMWFRGKQVCLDLFWLNNTLKIDYLSCCRS